MTTAVFDIATELKAPGIAITATGQRLPCHCSQVSGNFRLGDLCLWGSWHRDLHLHARSE